MGRAATFIPLVLVLAACSATDPTPAGGDPGSGGAGATPSGGSGATPSGGASITPGGAGGSAPTSSGGAPIDSGGSAGSAGNADDSGGSAGSAGSATEGVLDAPDTRAELEAFLDGEAYKSWPAEPGTHASVGPHAREIRVFYSPKAAGALSANEPTFPRGAAVVKELYAQGRFGGWAVWVKTETESANGSGFYWYEVLISETERKVTSDAIGAPECIGCHGAGRDYLLSAGTFE